MRIILIILLGLVVLINNGCSSTGAKSAAASYEKESAEQLYNKAQKALVSGTYDEAAKRFEALDALYPYSEYSQRAELALIYAYYANDEPAAALAAADRYIRLHPRSAHVDYAYYMKGVINFGRGRNWLQKRVGTDPAQRELPYMKNAFADFSELVTRFPDSRYAPDARRRMIYIRNLIARYEVSVAQFYYDRKAYVAAANRASYAFLHFQGSPQTIKALVLMVKANRKLGETKAADDALLVLKTNYPDVEELKELEQESSS